MLQNDIYDFVVLFCFKRYTTILCKYNTILVLTIFFSGFFCHQKVDIELGSCVSIHL